ncbi:MAG: LytTR family DNA-binding domain-containing protein [Saprospiraceae bacterium]
MNKTIRCMIVDDEPLAIKVIKSYIEKIQYLELVISCESAIDAFEELKKTPIDLIFLDIDMPHLTGIEFVQSLEQPPSIIFTTAYRNFAVESYELNAFDYLLKPIKFSRLFKSVDRYRREKMDEKPSTLFSKSVSNAKQVDYIYINSNKKNHKVPFGSILYVESIKDYIRIHCENRNIITKDKISDFSEKLPDSFLRIHRSFIVNTRKLSAFTSTDVEIGPKEIPIGVSYKKAVMAFLKRGPRVD